MNNAQRIARALRVIDEYDTQNNTDSDAATTLTDILTDFIHYCDAAEINFDSAVNMATIHFEAETGQ